MYPNALRLPLTVARPLSILPVKSMHGSTRIAAAALGLVLGIATSACDGLTSGSGDVEAPIELTPTATVDPTNSGGYRVVTDYCDCVTETLTLIDGRGNLTRIECTGVYHLVSAGGQEPVEATILGAGWRVSSSSQMPSDPHVGLRIDATCVEP